MNRNIFSALFLGLLAFGFSTVSNSASACSRADGDYSQENLFSEADEVFHALIVRTELDDRLTEKGGFGSRSGKQQRFLINVWYEVKEVFKGDPNPHGPVLTNKFFMGGCGTIMVTGQDYVLFVNGPDRFIDVHGTFGLSPNPKFLAEKLDPLRVLAAQHN